MALTYGPEGIPEAEGYIIFNNALLGDALRNMGYTAYNAFIPVKVTSNAAPAPPDVKIPSDADSEINSQTFTNAYAFKPHNAFHRLNKWSNSNINNYPTWQ